MVTVAPGPDLPPEYVFGAASQLQQTGWCGLLLLQSASQCCGIARDFGTYDTPDRFYTEHRKQLGPLRDLFYRGVVRHWMNARVRAIRSGRVPRIPGLKRPEPLKKEVADAA